MKELTVSLRGLSERSFRLRNLVRRTTRSSWFAAGSGLLAIRVVNILLGVATTVLLARFMGAAGLGLYIFALTIARLVAAPLLEPDPQTAPHPAQPGPLRSRQPMRAIATVRSSRRDHAPPRRGLAVPDLIGYRCLTVVPLPLCSERQECQELGLRA